MTYEQLLAQMHRFAPAAPPLAEVSSQIRSGLRADVIDRGRARFVQGFLGLVVFGCIATAVADALDVSMPGLSAVLGSGRLFALIWPLLLAIWSARRLRVRHFPTQVFIRAILWSNLVVGLLIAWSEPLFLAWQGSCICLGSGVALILLGESGLGIRDRVFRPDAFRGHLMIAVILACADASTLIFSALAAMGRFIPVVVTGQASVTQATHAFLVPGAPAAIAGLIMIVAVLGLMRMRIWALVLNIAANLGIAWAGFSGTLEVILPVIALSLTALAQLLLMVPILAAAVGDRNPDRRVLGRYGYAGWRGILIVLTLVGSLGWSSTRVPVHEGDGLLSVLFLLRWGVHPASLTTFEDGKETLWKRRMPSQLLERVESESP